MRTFRSPLLAFLALVLGAPFAAAKDLPEYNEEGMKLVESTRYTTVYADEDADLGIYKRVWLEDATVSFKKNWKREQNRNLPHKVKDSDMERIKAEVASLFREVFEEELSKGGYELATEAGDDVLRIVPEIVDLDVVAPDIPSAVRMESYSESAGEMTLQAVLYDSVTGDKIATTRDRKRDYRRGYMEWRTSVNNRATAKRLIRQWAVALREALDEARENVSS